MSPCRGQGRDQLQKSIRFRITSEMRVNANYLNAGIIDFKVQSLNASKVSVIRMIQSLDMIVTEVAEPKYIYRLMQKTLISAIRNSNVVKGNDKGRIDHL